MSVCLLKWWYLFKFLITIPQKRCLYVFNLILFSSNTPISIDKQVQPLFAHPENKL